MVDLSIYIPRPAGRQSDSNPRGDKSAGHHQPTGGGLRRSVPTSDPALPRITTRTPAPPVAGRTVTITASPLSGQQKTGRQICNLSAGYLSSFSAIKASMLTFSAIEIL